MTMTDSAVRRTRQRLRVHPGGDSSGGCGCGHQFAACVVKHWHEKRRDVKGSLLEFGLPLLFIVGSVLLWTAFDDSLEPGQQFVNSTHPGPWAKDSTSFDLLRSMLCVNATETPGGIGSLALCNFTASPSIVCFPPDPTVPVTGLCTTSITAIPGFLYGFLRTSEVSLVQPLSLDDIILMQWLTRLTIADTDFFYTGITAMSTSGKLYFTPNSTAVAALVDFFNQSSGLFSYIYGGTYSTETEAEAVVVDRANEGAVWGIIVARNLSKSNFDVEIRLNHTAMPQTSSVINEFYLGGVQPDNTLYLLSGFYTLEWMTTAYFLNHVATAVGYQVTAPLVVPMGYAPYSPQAFLSFGGTTIPLLIVLGFLYPVSQLAKRLVQEKELKIREAMQVMGLDNAPFYAAWVATYSAQHVILSIVFTVILKHTYLSRADSGIVFFTFFFFQLSTISLAGLISAFFSKARLAAIVVPLIYFATSIPLFAIQNAPASTKSNLLILSPTAFANAIQLLFQHELGGGLGPQDLTNRLDQPAMLSILFMLAVDTILYFLLWLYFDAVVPNDWGTPRSCCYCITDPLRYLWRTLSSSVSDSHGVDADGSSNFLPDGRASDGVFEDITPDERTTVQLCGLRKVFERGGKSFVAVNNLYWQMREGEISVLLGHNGAGKTTTMNMMTGMMPMDAGDCFIYGYSVRHELDMVRKEIGYCPQHNVLWPELTCEEHLRFYGSIKGLSGDALDDSVTAALRDVDLLEKRSELSSALSGGQKRKLSVAIAFVGGSRLIFLDEPTAGMDVAARRHTWTLLQRMSANHTILLTTHFMDEADLLGHVVGIMSKGSLQCSGSSLFLKSRLGVGYNIVLGVDTHVDQPRITGYIQRHIPSAELLNAGPGEITYRLPSAAVHAFPAMLADLETNGATIGVRNFTISATTLEEVFLKIAHGEHFAAIDGQQVPLHLQTDTQRLLPASEPTAVGREGSAAGIAVEMQPVARLPLDGQHQQQQSSSSPHGASTAGAKNGKDPASSAVWNVRRLELGSAAMFRSQFDASMRKRFKNSLRDRRTQCLQIVTPVICILIAMLFTLINIFSAPPIRLSPEIYGEPVLLELAGCQNLFNVTFPIPGTIPRVTPLATVGNAQNLSRYLAASANAHGDHPRYGAIACQDPTLEASTLIPNASVVFYNTSTFHELPIGVFTFFEQIYRKAYGSDASMKLVSNPMPKTAKEAALEDSIKSMLIGLIIMIPFTFIPSTFVSWIVKERECKARHLQNVSGLQFPVYWLSNFLFDMASFAITVFLALMVFLAFDRTEYIGRESIGATIVLFLFYGLSGVSFAYLTSFLFEEHATAQNIVMLGNFIAGFLLVLVVFILKFVNSTEDAAGVLAYIFRLVPSYCLGDGIINLARLDILATFEVKASPWDMDICGADILYMALEFPFVILLTLFIDHPRRRMRMQALLHDPNAPPEQIENEDEDVKKERYEVEHPVECHRDTDLIMVRNLRKVYDNGKVAVKNLSFGVHPGEVFGFLGTNGAGKTTTISILCQEFFPTSGHGTIAGMDIVDNAEDALKVIGYCPQFDALLDLLTVEEHLQLYAGLRGIVAQDRAQIVQSLAALCELTTYLETLASELSGGNRRKLSVALSLIGGPKVVFLDEPSAGMDPMARRGLWTAIETVADNCSIVLCSHHLEEIEALAHRVAIMVGGTLRCIGDKLHLKTKYGSGFELSVKISADAFGEPLHEFMKLNFPEAVTKETRSHRFIFALPQNTKLSSAFGLLEKHKESLGITDYSVSQTSIEQVFLQISAQAEHDDEVTAGQAPQA